MVADRLCAMERLAKKTCKKGQLSIGQYVNDFLLLVNIATSWLLTSLLGTVIPLYCLTLAN